MALANAACQLATKHGLNVIAVDWDLEAPGLHYYFKYNDSELTNKKGLIDYLEDFVEEVNKGESGSIPSIINYLTEIKEPVKSRIEHGSVRLLTCGKTDSNYMQRVQRLDWEEFYSNNQGYEIIETLKSQLRDEADVILVDARAGQSDMGLSPTIQVPDAVLLLFTSNRQSVDGTANIARKLKNHPFRSAQEIPSPILIFIPSRVFADDDRFDRWMLKTAGPVFNQLVTESIASRLDQPRGLRQCILGIESRYTFDEDLPVIETEHFESTLKEAYAQLARAITDLLEGRQMWDSDRLIPDTISLKEESLLKKQSIKKLSESDQNNFEELRIKLKEASIRGDDHKAAFYRFELGKLSIKSGNYDSAEVLFEAALTYNMSANNTEAISAILMGLAQLMRNQGNSDQAFNYLEEKLKIDKSNNNEFGISAAYFETGLTYIAVDKSDQAIKYFKLALDQSKKIDDTRLIAQIYNGLALAYYEKKKYSMAFKYATKFFNLSKESSISTDIITASFALSVILNAQKRYKDAIEAANVCLTYSKAENSYSDIAQVYEILGDNYKKLGDINTAKAMYQAAFAAVKKLGNKEWERKLREIIKRLEMNIKT